MVIGGEGLKPGPEPPPPLLTLPPLPCPFRRSSESPSPELTDPVRVAGKCTWRRLADDADDVDDDDEDDEFGG